VNRLHTFLQTGPNVKLEFEYSVSDAHPSKLKQQLGVKLGKSARCKLAMAGDRGDGNLKSTLCLHCGVDRVLRLIIYGLLPNN